MLTVDRTSRDKLEALTVAEEARLPEQVLQSFCRQADSLAAPDRHPDLLAALRQRIVDYLAIRIPWNGAKAQLQGLAERTLALPFGFLSSWVSAGQDQQQIAIEPIRQAVFLIDAARPGAGQVFAQRLGFADAI